MKRKRNSLIYETKQRIINMIQDPSWLTGSKLPSVRMLGTKMQCSLMTVVSAINELEQEGIIESRPRSGLYLLKKPKQYGSVNQSFNTENLFFFYNETAIRMDSYHMDIFQILNQESGYRHWNIKFENIENTGIFQQAVKDIHTAGIVCSTLRSLNTGVNPEIFRQKAPIVSYGIPPSRNNSCVFVDNYNGAWNAAEYMWNNNHHEIYYITALEETTVQFPERKSAILRFYQIHGGRVKQIIPWEIHQAKDQMIGLMKAFAASRRKKHLSLIVANSSMALEIYLIAQSMNIRIPEEMSIMAFIQRKTEEQHIDCMDFSRQEMANAILHLLAHPEMIAEQNSIMLKMKMEQHGSVRQLNEGEEEF